MVKNAWGVAVVLAVILAGCGGGSDSESAASLACNDWSTGAASTQFCGCVAVPAGTGSGRCSETDCCVMYDVSGLGSACDCYSNAYFAYPGASFGSFGRSCSAVLQWRASQGSLSNVRQVASCPL
ncbi:hypothetical protein [Anaeromyxobacter diazotrophicus]|uniref:Lipoprotein n=1 Tax=Anaeromyxobacter diazotrophicus TaxID=2590199 RepID=A0A7I9VQJ2_9BACT|nr:hypothetical protein [Anaeromyxobacter diazotrophicus]GEJ58675.1 hypothetical protein AMYX_34160 [Anaeromyxobacter diazotrophicus]